MHPNQHQWTLGQWVPPHPQSNPVVFASTLLLYFPLPDLSLTTNGQISSHHSKSFGLSFQVERNPWRSTGDHAPLFPSPYSDHSPDTDARLAQRDPTSPIATPPPDPYSVIQEQFRNAPWKLAGELEPKDPTTSRSVLHALLEERTNGYKAPTYKCCLCHKVFKRADRAITHLRHAHLDHRPFRCGGACGTKGCLQCFHSQENLRPHVKPKRVACSYCHYTCLRQNLKRHNDKCHPEHQSI